MGTLRGQTDERAPQVINAAGPFSDEVRGLSDAGAPKMIMASSGVHVTLPDYYSPDHLGMIVPKTKARAAVHYTCLDASVSALALLPPYHPKPRNGSPFAEPVLVSSFGC